MAEWLGRALQKLVQRFESAFDLFIFFVSATSGSSSVGRAQPCQGWGRGFESRLPLCVFTVLFLDLLMNSSCGGIGRHAGLKIL